MLFVTGILGVFVWGGLWTAWFLYATVKTRYFSDTTGGYRWEGVLKNGNEKGGGSLNGNGN